MGIRNNVNTSVSRGSIGMLFHLLWGDDTFATTFYSRGAAPGPPPPMPEIVVDDVIDV